MKLHNRLFKGVDYMKKFETPEIEVIKFKNTNMITTSYIGSGTDSEWDDF